MKIEIKEKNNVRCAIVNSEELVIVDGQSALDFIMTIKYDTECSGIALNKEAITEEFFILSSRIAGEVLQKMINYHTKFAIVGDFSKYTSKPLNDFIYECNSGRDIFFVRNELEATERLTSI